MNEPNHQAETAGNQPRLIAAVDAKLTELAEFVWACEAAARREDRIDAAIRLQVKAITWGGVVDGGKPSPRVVNVSRWSSR